MTSTTVPVGTVPGTVYSRFRCSTAGGDGPTGPAADGEVEDHRASVIGTDLGDAPDIYNTLLPTGPVHDVSIYDAPHYQGNQDGAGKADAQARVGQNGCQLVS